MTYEEVKKSLINLPRDIEFKVAGDTCTMVIEKSYANMQENCNAFEGWALLIKSCFPNANIVLDWNSDIPDTDRKNNAIPSQNEVAYNRFLYRVEKFEKLFGNWFSIPVARKEEVGVFNKKIKTNHVNNVCNSDSGYNPAKGIEHIIEKDFSLEGMNQKSFLEKLRAQVTPIKLQCVFDQLPNGLFEGTVKGKNRVFPTGYFDLWGIDDNDNLCIFELKKPQGNDHTGIVSELFFYAWFAYEYYGTNINSEKSKKEKGLRGYDELVARSGRLQNNKNLVKAYFLVKQFRAGLNEKIDNILALLNSALRDQGIAITFEVVRYDESWLSDKAKADITQLKQLK